MIFLEWNIIRKEMDKYHSLIMDTIVLMFLQWCFTSRSQWNWLGTNQMSTEFLLKTKNHSIQNYLFIIHSNCIFLYPCKKTSTTSDNQKADAIRISTHTNHRKGRPLWDLLDFMQTRADAIKVRPNKICPKLLLFYCQN